MPWQLAPGIEETGAVAALAIVGTAAPAPAIFWLIRSIGATSTSLLAYFIPLTAALIGVPVLGEALSFGMVAGFLLILAGATLMSAARSRLRERSAGRLLPFLQVQLQRLAGRR